MTAVSVNFSTTTSRYPFEAKATAKWLVVVFINGVGPVYPCSRARAIFHGNGKVQRLKMSVN